MNIECWSFDFSYEYSLWYDLFILNPVTLTLEFDPIYKTLTLLKTFEHWELELKYFTWVFLVIRLFRGFNYFWHCDLDLGVWPIFFTTLTLLITFEHWVLELWYFKWIFIVVKLFRSFIIFDTVTLTLEFDPFFENFNLANKFCTVSARALIFTWIFPVIRIFPLV